MADLTDIKAGDRVWVETGRYGKRIAYVARLTTTQIILVQEQREPTRFQRGSGKEVGYSTLHSYITKLATPDECAKHDARIEQERQASETRQREREQEEAERLELEGLFGEPSIQVAREYNRSVNGQPIKWSVAFYCATEEDVRRLAQMMRAERT